MLVAHQGLSRAALIFTALVGLWSLYHALRNEPLSGRLQGALALCEMLILAQVLTGVALAAGSGWSSLPRPFLHFLYGAVSLIALPAMYAYASQRADPRALTYGMAAASVFLFFALWRAVQVA